MTDTLAVTDTLDRAGSGGEPSAPVALSSRTAPATLASLLRTLGPGLLRVAVAPKGLGVTLGPCHIYDAQESQPDHADGLVLGVGIDPRRAASSVILEVLATSGAAALVLKGQEDLDPWVVDAAEQAGLAILTIPRESSWAQVHGLIRTAVAASGVPAALQVPGQAALGDLFRLADAIATMVGGATTIEDPDSVVLAYSSCDAPIDLPRQRTILGHRVPEDWMRKLHHAGVFRKLLSGDAVVHFQDPEGEILPRLAVAVRAGGELLGTLWVVQGERPFTQATRDALQEAAKIAALHLIQHRNVADYERSRRSENLRAVLRGDLPPSAADESVAMAPGAVVTVAAFELPSVSGPELALRLQRLVDLILLYCSAYRRNAGAVVVGDVAYMVVAESGAQPDRIHGLARDIADRARDSLKVSVRVGLSHGEEQLDSLPGLRHEADQALRVLRDAPDLGPVAGIDELRSQVFLLQLREFFSQHQSAVMGKLQPLLEEDARRATGYIDTLRAYLEHFGDIATAASTIPVHSNTFRYRIGRLTSLAGIDLADPDERLVLQLQLRMLP